MGVTSGVAPPPPLDPRRATKRAMRTAELAPAGWPGQLASYLQIVLAIGLLCAWVDNAGAFATTAGALGAGVLVGTLTPIGARFANLSGMVAALAAVFVTVLLLAFSDGRLFGDEPWLVPIVVGLAVLGLDWCFVPRLRARAVSSGLLVVPLVGANEGWAYAGAVGWFLGVLVTLWLLERDVRAAAMRPVPLAEVATDRSTNAMDVVRAAGVGLAIGLVAALLFGDASCSLRQDSHYRLSVDDPPSSRSAPSSGSSSGGPPLLDLDASGREYEYRLDELGRRYVMGQDGARLYVEESGGQTLLRDEGGRLRAEVGDDRVTVYGENGDTQTYQRGKDGGLNVEGADGQQYTLEDDGSRWVLRDETGTAVARSDPSISPDHLYIRDAEGNVLVPDPNGDGLIPVPDADGSGGLVGGGPGRVYERDENGDVVVRDPQGNTRTYGRDEQGRDRVRVESEGNTRTFVYDESGDGMRITEYDEDGDVVDEYLYDREGRGLDTPSGSSSAGSGGSTSSGAAGTARAADDDQSTDVPWGIIGLVVLGVAALLALVVWLRRDRGPATRAPRSWAEQLARRLEDEGRKRGRARARGETVVDHSAALSGGPLPDARVATVGQLLSSALFSRRQPSPETRRWAESVVDDVSGTFPPPSRREQRRGKGTLPG